jgi:TolB-like protein/class 3 adenylate cyclase
MSQCRHLAAIMFTDIVGYTRVMGKDEARAMGMVHRSHNIQKGLVEEFEGEWLKEMGDGVMCSFSSASDAVYCALEIQEQLSKHEDLQLRIGIHLGEILVENGDIFSDGVNIAARLQNIAEPGGIYLSEAVQKAIRGQTDIHTVYLGEVQLKNVDYGIKTYALRGEGLPPVINGAAKRLSGRVWAEVKRRNLHRAGTVYLAVAMIVLSLIPVIPVFKLFQIEIIATVCLGLIVAFIMAWNFERSPEGLIRTSSAEAWQNPYTNIRKKPYTSNLVILFLIFMLMVINAFTFIDGKTGRLVDTYKGSIAVLPFDNFSNDLDQQYFADGIQDDILTELSRNPVFDVRSRTSTLQYRHKKNISIPQIGDELGVEHILEGSIRKSGNRIKVTVQLIESRADTHVCSGVYERELHDTLVVQQELARTIARMIRDEISDSIFEYGEKSNSEQLQSGFSPHRTTNPWWGSFQLPGSWIRRSWG